MRALNSRLGAFLFTCSVTLFYCLATCSISLQRIRATALSLLIAQESMIGARFTLLNATNPFIAWPQSPGDNKEPRGVCSPFHTEGFASWELHETEAPAQRPSVSTVDLEQQLRLARIVTPLFPSRLAARGSARNSPLYQAELSHRKANLDRSSRQR